MIAVLGAMLGTTFTPDRLDGALGWLPTLSALPLYVVLVGGVIFAYLRRFSGIDPTSAFFAATPGGLSEMIALSDQLGGDQRFVSLVHGARLLFIVATIPFLAWLFGHAAAGARDRLSLSFDPMSLAMLAALAGARLPARAPPARAGGDLRRPAPRQRRGPSRRLDRDRAALSPDGVRAAGHRQLRRRPVQRHPGLR